MTHACLQTKQQWHGPCCRPCNTSRCMHKYHSNPARHAAFALGTRAVGSCINSSSVPPASRAAGTRHHSTEKQHAWPGHTVIHALPPNPRLHSMLAKHAPIHARHTNMSPAWPTNSITIYMATVLPALPHAAVSQCLRKVVGQSVSSRAQPKRWGPRQGATDEQHSTSTDVRGQAAAAARSPSCLGRPATALHTRSGAHAAQCSVHARCPKKCGWIGCCMNDAPHAPSSAAPPTHKHTNSLPAAPPGACPAARPRDALPTPAEARAESTKPQQRCRAGRGQAHGHVQLQSTPAPRPALARCMHAGMHT